jgi:hypothetical protein
MAIRQIVLATRKLQALEQEFVIQVHSNRVGVIAGHVNPLKALIFHPYPAHRGERALPSGVLGRSHRPDDSRNARKFAVLPVARIR